MFCTILFIEREMYYIIKRLYILHNRQLIMIKLQSKILDLYSDNFSLLVPCQLFMS